MCLGWYIKCLLRSHGFNGKRFLFSFADVLQIIVFCHKAMLSEHFLNFIAQLMVCLGWYIKCLLRSHGFNGKWFLFSFADVLQIIVLPQSHTKHAL
jgi:hypothetical protein